MAFKNVSARCFRINFTKLDIEDLEKFSKNFRLDTEFFEIHNFDPACCTHAYLFLFKVQLLLLSSHMDILLFVTKVSTKLETLIFGLTVTSGKTP